MSASTRSQDPLRSRSCELVRLGNADAAEWLHEVCQDVVADDVPTALALASRLTLLAPAPGGGSTLIRWELLASLGAADLTTARVVEAHLDAVAILAEAGASQSLEATTWGVFAAEGPGHRLDATTDGDSWRLDGVKPWCSLAGELTHALVTAHTPDGRRLFAVSLSAQGVRPDVGAWHARGLVHVPSGPVSFDGAPAVPVGSAGWYLQRPGFAYGGLGVAACWYGGAVGLARTLARSVHERTPDDIALWHLGRVDVALHRARVVLAEAATAVDAGAATGSAGELLAARARAVVADTAEQVLTSVGHALGPTPLALNEDHSRRVADLTLYLRQHHAERDEVALGRRLSHVLAPW